MMILLAFAVVFVIAGSIFADHKWHRWIDGHKPQRAWPYEAPFTPTSVSTEHLSETPDAGNLAHNRDHQ